MKLMKKKVNVFGKSIPVLAIFVLGIALVSAALVPYLSNAITGNVVVDSPFTLEMKLAEGSVWSTSTIDIVDMHGSDSFELWTKLTNNADGLVEAAYVEIIVSNDKETQVECAEFKMQVTGTSGWTACKKNTTDKTAVLRTSAIDLAGGTDQIIPFTVFSAVNIEPATYTFTAQIPL